MADDIGGSTSTEGGSAPSQVDAGSPIDQVDGARSDKGAQLEAEGGEPAPRKIKPIPSPSKGTGRLPGVQDRGAEDFLDSLGRDEKGRFTKTRVSDPSDEPSEAPAGQSDKPPVDAKPGEAPKPPAAPQTEAPVKFLGKDYKALGEVEQLHRSLQGQFRGLTEQRDYGYAQANGWKAHADRESERANRLEAELTALKSGRPGGVVQQSRPGAGAAAPAQGLSVDDILADIDTDTFETVIAEGGLPAGGKYLVAETLKAVMERVVPQLRQELSGQFDSRIKPFEDSASDSQTRETVESLVQSVGGLMTHAGTPAFPELSDPAALQEIGQIWTDAGFPPELALTPKGLIQAVGVYRVYKGLPEAGAPVASTAVAPPTSSAPASRPAPGSAASLDDSRSPGRPPSNGRSNLGPGLQELLSGFNTEDLAKEANLGFVRRRRPSPISE